MPLKINIGCCNHLFGEGLKKLLLEECNLDTDSIITVSTNPGEITKEDNDLLITDFNTLAGIIFDDVSRHESFSLEPDVFQRLKMNA